MSTPALDDAEPRVDDDVFRHVVGHFASGVAVVTTTVDGVAFGTTVSAVSSLSMDPPMMLVCLNRSSHTHDQVQRAQRFAINVLSAEQTELAFRFAKKSDDKFAGVAVEEVLGVPTLEGALARIVCSVDEEATGGTHTVFLGRVLDARASSAQPLTYYRGAFGSFHSEAEEHAYLTVRRWVLEHRELRGDSIDLDLVAGALELSRETLGRAIAKLAVDRLVTVEPGNRILILPITAELMRDCVEGRAAIECGVLTTQMSALTDDVAREIRDIYSRMQQLRSVPGAMREFLDLNTMLQDRITGLAGSLELTRAFNRMGIGAVWSHTVPVEAWDEFFDGTSQGILVAALERRDVEAACRAVQAHAAATTTLVRELLQSNGGSV